MAKKKHMEYITQSFIKDLWDYLADKQCGLQIEAKYYDGIDFPPSEVQLLGQWFEYKATGQKTRNGKIPEPPLLKGGAYPKKFNDILAHIEPLKRMLSRNGFEIKRTGLRLKHNGIQGDYDIEAFHIPTQKNAIIDIKTSGLIHDKWSEYGWDIEALDMKDRIMIQPVHYKMLGFFEYGYEPDFYFFVFSSTNTYDRKLIKVEVDEDRFEQHRRTIDKVKQLATHHENKGWEAKPSIQNCHGCPLADGCKHFTDIPEIEVVHY